MFGNRTGWIISGVLVALMFLVVFQLAQLNATTLPSTGAITKDGKYALKLQARPEMLDEIKLPFEPTSVYPGMTKSADAGALYRSAIAEHAKDPYAYDPTRSKLASTEVAKYPALKPLLDAREMNKMTLFADHPDEVINYKKFQPEAITAISAVGSLAVKLAQLKPEAEKAEAIDLAEAAFSLGVKMCQERVRWPEFEAGQRLVTEGAFMIGALDPARKDACKAATDEMRKLVKERCLPMAMAVTSIDPNVMGRTAGDIFYIVKNSKERMWRVEAVLKMGHYKYNAGEPGNAADQRYARIYAKRLMNNDAEDPLVRAAAKQAFELTKEDYSMIGSG
jgi:hypothetical protein